jgi:ketosteroid isomerase-like protein
MTESARLQIVRACFAAYEDCDRDAIERLLPEDFTFSSPADVGIDRARYFERCWPAAGTTRSFELKRLHEAGDDVVVTYEAERFDGSRFRNTEIFSFDDDRLRAVEVYFGWNLS